MMRLLLHICCAPCLIYPIAQLKQKGFAVTGFFYNPNIHPFSEYNNRKQALEMVSQKYNIEVIYPEYMPQEFFQAVNLKENSPQRCRLCWSMRLGFSAKYAKEKGFTHFTTTLLVSPYQDQEALKEIGNKAAGAYGVEFYYEDFRTGFRAAHDKAKSEGIYCQKYCGCIYSEIERFSKAKQKK